MSNNQLNDLSKTYLEAVYGGKKKEEPKDTRLVVTAADKKANTKAYQNYKAGHKAYKAADHLKDDYEFARHKASIISRGGRLEDAVESWNQKLAYREAMKDVSEKKEVNVKDTYKTVAAVIQGGVDESVGSAVDKALGAVGDTAKVAGKAAAGTVKVASKVAKGTAKAAGRAVGTAVGVAKAAKKGFKSGADANESYEVREGYGKKKKKKHDCASKVKHEEFGIGNPIKGMHDLDENGKVAHYDVFFEHGIEKNVPVSSLEILEGHMHEHVIREKMAAKDYDGDGKIESGKDEYFGSKDKAIKKAMAKRVKKESLSDWRDDLSDLIEIVAEPEEKAEKKVKEGKVNNKVVINPKISEAIQEMGGEVLEHHQVDCDDDCEPNCEHDIIEEGKGKKNCGCGQDPCITYGEQKEGSRLKKSQVEESYDEIDDDLLLFVESSLGNFPEDQILDMMESMWHRRNPGKKHPLESGSSKVKRRPVSDAEKKSTDKSDRMYVAMRRVKDRQKGYSKDKSDAADRLHSSYTDRQSKRKAGASSKEAAAQSHGEFGGKGFRIKRGGRSGKAPGTDRGKGSKAKKRAAALTKEENIFSRLMEADKKGKGSGTKDACYHKVKASAKVWPSAYASGRLVQCRKKGAANYGKGSD